MTAPVPSAPDPRSRRPAAIATAAGRRHSRVLPLLLALGIVLVLAAVVGGQLLRVRAAAHDLQAHVVLAQEQLTQLAPEHGLSEAQRMECTAIARSALNQVQADASRLAGLLGSTPFALSTALPFVGEDVRAARELATDAELLSRQVLPVLLDAVVELQSGPRHGPLDLRPLTSRAESLRAARKTMQAVSGRARGNHPHAGVLLHAQQELMGRLAVLQALMGPVQTVADVGAGMTGERGPRRYLVVLQTPAESRATGGLVGGFIEVVVDSGIPRIVRQGSNADLENRTADVVTIPGGFNETWGSYGAQRGWSVSNLSPDFPSVAKVWAALYTSQFGVPVDGVVGVTPEAISHLLQGRSPIGLANSATVDEHSVTRLLERGVYERFPAFEQEAARNAYQQDVLRRLLEGVLLQPDQGVAALLAVRDAVNDGSLHLASMHVEEQADLAGTAVAGSLPRGAEPFIAWTTQNVSGSKLDVYLHRQLSYRRQALGGGMERATATASLRNDAPVSGLPAYVAGRTRPAGTNEVLLATYLTRGATVTSVRVDGRAVEPMVRVEGGHPVVLVQVPLAPAGGSATVVVVSEQAASTGPVATLQQLVSNPDDRVVLDPPTPPLKR